MAKNSVRDFSSTAASNTDIQSVNIDENCAASGINNAIREVMADLKDVSVGTVALESPKFDSILDGNIKATDASGTDTAGTATTIKGGAGTGTGAGGSIIFQVADGAGSTGSSVNAHATAMTITDDGNVDIAGGLNVGTIKEATGTTTAMTIDSSGRVGFANPILVQAYMTTTMTSAGIIIWNNKIIDTANAYSTTTGQFTCPKAGYYEVSFNYLARNVSSGHRTNVRKNGTKQGIDSSNSLASLVWSVVPTGTETNMAASTIVECAVDDLLDVHLTSIGAGDIYGNINSHNNLTIKFLG